METRDPSRQNADSLRPQSATRQKPYVRPECTVLTPVQVQMKLADAPPNDRQADEWLALIAATPKMDAEHVREQLRLALTHLSNAQKDCDLAGIIDALEIARARDCIAVALRDCGS